jgi:hypothetical protein
MSVNGEAIFGSRPFKIYGENSAKVGNPGTRRREDTAQDIRFTVKEHPANSPAPAFGRRDGRMLDGYPI